MKPQCFGKRLRTGLQISKLPRDHWLGESNGDHPQRYRPVEGFRRSSIPLCVNGVEDSVGVSCQCGDPLNGASPAEAGVLALN